MKPVKIILLVIVAVIAITVLSLVLRACAFSGKMVDNAFETAEEEFSPSELLRKYEWFKNALAAMDAKKADIQIADSRMKNMETSYEDTSRKDWDRTDKEQYNLWSNEVAGLKISYNKLAAEYNANMSKFNWRFTNAGSLPKGHTEVLPRDVREYSTE